MTCIKQLMIVGLLLFSFHSTAQITEGRIVFERKTNLEKVFKGNERVERFLGDDPGTKIEKFELFFNDTCSAFIPIPPDVADQGFTRYLTSHNQVYRNMKQEDKLIVMDAWGQETFVKDSLQKRPWKITDRTRDLAGYEARKCYYEMNDSTRIYAWFTTEIIPTTGPEGFGGLPGTILGLATEDGSIIYFAKKVEIMKVPKEKLIISTKGKDVYSKDELKELLLQKMGKWIKEEDIDGMYAWF